MSKEKQEINRGILAQQVIDNPVYKESIILIKADLMQKFETTKYSDSDQRDEIWRTMQNLNRLENKIARVMQTGKMSQTMLDKIKGVKIG